MTDKKILFILLPAFALLCCLSYLLFTYQAHAEGLNNATEENKINKNSNIYDKDIPTINLTLNGVTLEQINSGSKETKYEGNSIVAQEKEHSDISFSNVEIKGRGNTTWFQPKKPYQIKFDSKVSLFGLDKSKKYVLLANYLDASNLRNSLAFESANLMSSPFVNKGVFIELVVNDSTSQNQYIGLYWLTNKLEISSASVDSGKNGVLFESDGHAPEEGDPYFYSNIEQRRFVLKDSASEDPERSKMFNAFRDKYNTFETCVYNNKDFNEIKQYIDVESFAKYFLLSEFVFNPDAFFTSLYFYMDGENDVIHCGPPWDFDLALCNYGGEYNDPGRSELMYWPLSKNLMKYPEFTNLICTYYNNYLKSNKNYLINYVNNLYSKLKPFMQKNWSRWGGKDPESAVKYLLTVIDKRYAYMDYRYSYNVDLPSGIYTTDIEGYNKNYNLEKLEDGYYCIKNIDSDLVLDVYGGSFAEGTSVSWFPWHGGDNQRWSVSCVNGKYILFSKLTCFVLDNSSGLKIKSLDKSSSYFYSMNSVLTSDQPKIINLEKEISRVSVNIPNITSTQPNFGINLVVKPLYCDQTKKYKCQISQSPDSTYTATASFNISDFYYVYGTYVIEGEAVYENKTVRLGRNNFNIVCDKPIDNGTYIIGSALNYLCDIDLYASSHENGANVEIFNHNLCNNQNWDIILDNDGWYYIKSVESKKVLDVNKISGLAGSNIEQYSYHGGDNQKWKFCYCDDGVKIISKINYSFSLDLANSSTQPCSNILLFNQHGGSNQTFQLFPYNVNVEPGDKIQEGVYKIESCEDNNMLVDIYNSSRDNCTDAIIWSDNDDNSLNQQFYIKDLNNGYYEIQCCHSGKVLDVCFGDIMPESKIVQFDKGSLQKNQMWSLKKQSDNTFIITSVLSGLVIDVMDHDVSQGNKLCTNRNQNLYSQKWKLVKIP